MRINKYLASSGVASRRKAEELILEGKVKVNGKVMAQKNRTNAEKVRITDDAMVVETFMDVPVGLVQGSYENIKVTTPEDMAVAETLAQKIFGKQ